MARKRRATETELRHRRRVPVPPDIVESILARLPVKSILRFRSVSKLWNQIICCPYLSNLHSQAQLAAASSSFPTRFLIRAMPTVTATSTSFCLLNFSGKKFQLDAELGFPSGVVCINGYCNGLLLLNCGYHKYMLWNPYTRMHKRIPSIRKSEAVGICHDPTTGDYKVVIINLSPTTFSVFSCKQRIWTKLNEILEYDVLIIGGGVYVDGAYYWICNHFEQRNKRCRILCFDGVKDKCEMLQLPASIGMGLGTTISFDMALLNLKGCLGLIYRDYQYGRICIASMEKNGDGNTWRRQMAIEFKRFHYTVLSERAPCPISDSLVVIFLNAFKFIVYDVCKESVVQGLRKFPRRWEGMLVPYHQRLFISMF